MTANRNYSSTAVATALTTGISSATTAISVGSVSGFPGTFPYTLVLEGGTANQEIITVTAGTGLNRTVIRGEDGSAAVAHSTGAAVTHDVSARDYQEAGNHVGASAAVHGVTGSVVGTTDTQTLTNKTISNSAIDGSNTIGGVAASLLVPGAWTSFTCTVTGAGSNPTSQSSTTFYCQVGKILYLTGTVTSAGGTGLLTYALPGGFTVLSPSFMGAVSSASGAIKPGYANVSGGGFVMSDVAGTLVAGSTGNVMLLDAAVRIS